MSVVTPEMDLMFCTAVALDIIASKDHSGLGYHVTAIENIMGANSLDVDPVREDMSHFVDYT